MRALPLQWCYGIYTVWFNICYISFYFVGELFCRLVLFRAHWMPTLMWRTRNRSTCQCAFFWCRPEIFDFDDWGCFQTVAHEFRWQVANAENSRSIIEISLKFNRYCVNMQLVAWFECYAMFACIDSIMLWKTKGQRRRTIHWISTEHIRTKFPELRLGCSKTWQLLSTKNHFKVSFFCRLWSIDTIFLKIKFLWFSQGFWTVDWKYTQAATPIIWIWILKLEFCPIYRLFRTIIWKLF